MQKKQFTSWFLKGDLKPQSTPARIQTHSLVGWMGA